MGFLQTTETAVTAGFKLVADPFGAALLDTFRPAFIIGFTIWITLIAYEVAFGKSEDGFTYVFTKIGKIFLIGVLALYGWPELAELLEATKQGFVGSNTISKVLETNLLDPLGAAWLALFSWMGAVINSIFALSLMELASTLFQFILLFWTYFLMSVVVAVFACIALAMYMVANSVFILLMAVGPFFLLCLAFPFLQRFFENFVGNVMTSILAMAFTVLMVLFVVNFFGLDKLEDKIPTTTAGADVANGINSLIVLFISKAGTALLIIYLTFKVFDLASALGGGLSMGNNMVGGVRSIMKDLQRGSGAGKAQGATNSMSQGSSSGGGNQQSASQKSARANSTFTGMAASAAKPAISSVARPAIAGARAVGQFAYNRFSQLSASRSRS